MNVHSRNMFFAMSLSPGKCSGKKTVHDGYVAVGEDGVCVGSAWTKHRHICGVEKGINMSCEKVVSARAVCFQRGHSANRRSRW